MPLADVSPSPAAFGSGTSRERVIVTHFGFLSTYPPTRCGLATFTAALADALVSPVDGGTIVRVIDGPHEHRSAEAMGRSRVRGELIADDRLSIARTAGALNACDVTIVQHEYGIFGGPDGDQVLAVLEAVRTPTIVVLHTVLVAPSAHQREVLEAVCRLASVVVVMTANALAILTAHYSIDASRVHVIPHGVAPMADGLREPHRVARVLTWGLISPGKGIEWGIRAIAELADLAPSLEYVVAGQTHPKVLAHAGESYRESLQALVREFDIAPMVQIDGRYLDADQLHALVASADVVLLPYDSRDQATSGVLAEAVAAGVPVVATGFPHAVELLAGGAGIVVAHEDPHAIAVALRTILTGRVIADRMRAAALRAADDVSWAAVADRYRSIAVELLAAQAA